MAKIKDYGEGRFGFHCPGCKHEHIFFVNNAYWKQTTGTDGWTFNGNFEQPTFSPSLLNKWGKNADQSFDDEGDPALSGQCHLFVKNGHIEYCGDCSHEFAGKTVELHDIV